jgi:hypothetical protein
MKPLVKPSCVLGRVCIRVLTANVDRAASRTGFDPASSTVVPDEEDRGRAGAEPDSGARRLSRTPSSISTSSFAGVLSEQSLDFNLTLTLENR